MGGQIADISSKCMRKILFEAILDRNSSPHGGHPSCMGCRSISGVAIIKENFFGHYGLTLFQRLD
jgi:hypothetical protein